jgi:hypothetical protein
MERNLLPFVVLTAGLAGGQTASQPLVFEAASLKVAGKKFIPGVTFKMTGRSWNRRPGALVMRIAQIS